MQYSRQRTQPTIASGDVRGFKIQRALGGDEREAALRIGGGGCLARKRSRPAFAHHDIGDLRQAQTSLGVVGFFLRVLVIYFTPVQTWTFQVRATDKDELRRWLSPPYIMFGKDMPFDE